MKPDWRIRGGFELVVDRLVAGLEAEGHRCDWHLVDVPSLTHAPFGREVKRDVWDAAPEYFRYLSMVDAFQDLDVRLADVVVSTQPPSFATRYGRHVSLFFHHHRIYYDLSEVYVAAGFADPVLHEVAQNLVRAVDQQSLAGVDRFLVSSDEVRHRLADYSGVADRVAPCRVGITRSWSPPADPVEPTHVLCVSRHEFPKRTELFVEAMVRLPDLRGVMVGSGGRLPRVRWLEGLLHRQDLDATPVADELTWLNDGELREPIEAPAESNVSFAQGVTDRHLYELYSGAFCVVAPAYREDYGLTALEAMAVGVPVIVCEDGGGLRELVVDGVSGLVVEPSGTAIAAAVRQLVDDPDLRRELGRNGREVASEFTWKRTLSEFLAGVEGALS